MICRTPTRDPFTARAGRGGFTLVELMVTITIVLIMMSILAVASSIAAETFRGAKVQGDFVAQERAALAVLRRDLTYRHFLEEDGKPNLGRKLSDQRLDKLYVDPATGRLAGYKPPKSGYFYAESRPAPTALAGNPAFWDATASGTWNWYENQDGEGFNSSRSGNHVLQFTIITPGGAPEDTLTADVPFQNPLGSSGYPIIGRAAEVAYFLVPNGQTPNGVGKYKLVRRQRLAAFNDDDRPAYSSLLANQAVPITDSSEVMAVNSGTTVLHLNDLTLAARRLGGSLAPARAAITAYRVGEDVLLTNVTSFEIKFTGTANGIVWPTPFVNGNTDYPYDNLPFDGKYDTFHQFKGVPTVSPDWDLTTNLASATNTAGTLKKIRITGVSIRLRCWNQNSKGSRQTTIQVDL